MTFRSILSRGLLFVALLAVVPGCGLFRQAGTPFSSRDAGLNVPESAIYDSKQGVYFVSNINGSPFGEDGKGFISRFGLDGDVQALKAIDGAQAGVTLNAPKGLALHGDTLYVADVTAVRKFHRYTGAPLGSIDIEGTTFLNDLACGADGTIYVTDTGLKAGFEASLTDAIYAISPSGEVKTLAKGVDLQKPNGLFVDGDRLLFINWDGGELRAVNADGSTALIHKLPANQLDGVEKDNQGNFLISSWAGKCVYRISPGGAITEAVRFLEAPADIGWNGDDELLLLPWFNAKRLDVLSVAP